MKMKRPLGRTLLFISVLFASIAMGTWAYAQHPKFGRLPEGERLERIQRSPNYAGDGFRNLEANPVFTGRKRSRFSNMIGFLFRKRDGLRPSAPLPVVKTDLKSLPRDRDVLVWLGHSSCFLQVGGKRILIDPVFSRSAAPLGFLNRAFDGTTVYSAEDMPEIDYLLITHDHWDHLDYPTIKALKAKVRKVVTGLGVGAHFDRWGYPTEQVHEADWWDVVKLDEALTLHVLPARHFSGRMFTRNKSLWVGFALVIAERRILFSGDTGYGKHFAEIARRLGGVDLAVLDTGQYNERWAYSHMFPEQAAQAAEDLGAKALLPGHIGRFSISTHRWDDPFKRVAKASEGKPYRLLTPLIGMPVHLDDTEQRFERWWEKLQ